jgi:hypothetical protein
MRLRRMGTVALLMTTGALTISGAAVAQDDLSIWIEKHARLTANGSVVFVVHVECGPLPGTEDFREGLAFAIQPKTGAAAEGGLSPDIVCDGLDHVYVAGVSLDTDAQFTRGPAIAIATVFACNVVADQQVCVHASVESRIVISGRIAA